MDRGEERVPEMTLINDNELMNFRQREAYYERALKSVEDCFKTGTLNGEHADAETAQLFDEWNTLDEECSELCHAEGHPSFDESNVCTRCGIHR